MMGFELNTVTLSQQEQEMFRKIAQCFFEAHPGYQFHQIKITRPKRVNTLISNGLQTFYRRHLYYDYVNNHDKITLKTPFICPEETGTLEDNQFKHSCIIMDHCGTRKMIIPQNKRERAPINYYKHKANNITVKRAAVYHYQKNIKERELIYKSTLIYGHTERTQTFTNRTTFSGKLYWDTILHRYNITDNGHEYN